MNGKRNVSWKTIDFIMLIMSLCRLYINCPEEIINILRFRYFWNGFSILESHPEIFVTPILEDIESYWNKFPSDDINDICVYEFLRGVCLKVSFKASLAVLIINLSVYLFRR